MTRSHRSTFLDKAGITTLAALGLAFAGPQAHAQTLYVSRVGTGASALGSTATAEFIDQYSTAAGQSSAVASLALPTTKSGSNYALTDSATASSDGTLTLSTNGQYLTIQGYNDAVGTTGVASSTPSSSTNQRVVALITVPTSGNISGATVDTSTALSNPFPKGNFRSSVYDTTANKLYLGGQDGSGTTTNGIFSSAVGASSATVLNTTKSSIRDVNLYNGTLYASTTTAITSVNLSNGALTNVVSDATNAPSPYDFVFADNGSTLYVADSTKGLVKYTKSGSTFSFAYSFAVTNGLFGLALGAPTAGGNDVLYGIANSGSSANKLFSFTDTGSTFTSSLIATAAANTSFKGVEFLPAPPASAPEPSGMVALAIGAGALGLLAARRRKVAA